MGSHAHTALQGAGLSMRLNKDWFNWLLRRRYSGYYNPFVCYESRKDGWLQMVRGAPQWFRIHAETRCQKRWKCYARLGHERKGLFHVHFTPAGVRWARMEITAALLRGEDTGGYFPCRSHD